MLSAAGGRAAAMPRCSPGSGPSATCAPPSSRTRRPDAALDRLREADAQLAALGAEQQAVAAQREATEADRVGAGKDVERLVEDVRRASAFADALRIEAAELSAEAGGVAVEIRSQREELARVESAAEAAAAEVARPLAAIDADAAAETAGAQAFLQAQVDLAGLAGRIDAAEGELVRVGTDEAETRRRIDGGGAAGARARPAWPRKRGGAGPAGAARGRPRPRAGRGPIAARDAAEGSSS